MAIVSALDMRIIPMYYEFDVISPFDIMRLSAQGDDMAIVEQFIASAQLWDSAQKLASASFYVGAVDARAYLAAADQTARDATKVGLLLNAAINMTHAEGEQYYRKYSVEANFVNDQAENASPADQFYNSNKWKVTCETTRAGLPALDTVYIPMRDPTQVTMQSDGVSVNLTLPAADDLIAQIVDTALSKYGTAITGVVSITANDI